MHPPQHQWQDAEQLCIDLRQHHFPGCHIDRVVRTPAQVDGVSVSFGFDGLLDAPPLLDELDEVPSPFDPLGVPGPSGLLEGLVLSALDGDVVPGPSCGFAD
jgi:hypothetical protein